MIIQVVDANGVTQFVVWNAPATPTDRSGTIQNTNATQTLLDPVPQGSYRSGWVIQNNGQSGNTIQINDIGNPADQSPSSYYLPPGATFPPPGYPPTQGEVNIAGVAGDNFMAREW